MSFIKSSLADDNVVVYADADDKSPVVAQLSAGAKVVVGRILTRDGQDWVKVTLSTNQKGFIRGETKFGPMSTQELASLWLFYALLGAALLGGMAFCVTKNILTAVSVGGVMGAYITTCFWGGAGTVWGGMAGALTGLILGGGLGGYYHGFQSGFNLGGFSVFYAGIFGGIAGGAGGCIARYCGARKLSETVCRLAGAFGGAVLGVSAALILLSFTRPFQGEAETRPTSAVLIFIVWIAAFGLGGLVGGAFSISKPKWAAQKETNSSNPPRFLN